MFPRQLETLGPIALLLAAAVTAALAVRRGWGRESAFADAPPRRAGLVPSDILVALLFLLAGSLLVPGAWAALDGLQPADIEPASAARRLALRSLVAQALTQLPAVLYVLWRARQTPDGFRELGVLPPARRGGLAAGWRALAGALALTMGMGVLVSLVGEWLVEPTPRIGHEMLEAMRQRQARASLAMLLVSAVVVAPVLEEVLFRGLVQTALLEAGGRGRRWAVIFVAASWFALVHVGQPWQALPPLFVLGIVLGWVYERTGSLAPCVIVHAGFNAVNAAWAILLVEG